MAALDEQVGGNHYKEYTIQPVEFLHKNGIGYMEGNVIKYVCRWKSKGGIQDLEKAKHYIDLLIALESKPEMVEGTMSDERRKFIEKVASSVPFPK